MPAMRAVVFMLCIVGASVACTGESRTYSRQGVAPACPSLAQELSGSLAAVEARAYPDLVALVEAASFEEKRWLIETAVGVIEVAYPIIKRGVTGDLDLRVSLGEDGATPPAWIDGALFVDIFADLRGGLDACALDALLPLVEATVMDGPLFEALVALFAGRGLDPLTAHFCRTLPDPCEVPEGARADGDDVAAFVAFSLGALAALKPDADPEVVAGLVDLLIPVGEPPFDLAPFPALNAGVKRLITGDALRLSTTVTLLACLEEAEALARLPALIGQVYEDTRDLAQWEDPGGQAPLIQEVTAAILAHLALQPALPYEAAGLFRSLQDQPAFEPALADLARALSSELVREWTDLIGSSCGDAAGAGG
jgi:hypothetical protein